jgi:protein-tyrosine phosphatase
LPKLYKNQIGARVVYGSSAPCRNLPLGRVPLTRTRCFIEFVRAIGREDIARVLVLLSDNELDCYYHGALVNSYKGAGFKVMRYPIPDFGVPSDSGSFAALERRLVEITAKERILIHCGAGVGRTGQVLCGLHVALGGSAQQALVKVRKVSPGSVETDEQEEFVRKYAEMLSSIRTTDGIQR